MRIMRSKQHFVLWNYDELFEITDLNVRLYLRSELEILRRLSKAADCSFAKKFIKSVRREIQQYLYNMETGKKELDMKLYIEILDSISKKMQNILDYFDLKILN
jgi:hypothetical protein